MIKEWLEEYKPANKEAAEQALREIMRRSLLQDCSVVVFLKRQLFFTLDALRCLIFLQVKCMHYYFGNGIIELKAEIGMIWNGI